MSKLDELIASTSLSNQRSVTDSQQPMSNQEMWSLSGVEMTNEEFNYV